MGWKCTDCGDRGPEHDISWCPDCGSTSWQPTDADGLTAADRAEQAEMTREAIAEARADRLFGYLALFTSASMAYTVALLFFHDSIWRENVAVAVFLACIYVASFFNEHHPDDVVDHLMYPWEWILEDARLGRDIARAAPPPADIPAPGLDDSVPFQPASESAMKPRLRHHGPTAAPPPIHLQAYICEHRRGPDEFRSELIRRDRFLDPDNADAYFELVEARLRPGEFVVLRLGGKNPRLSHAGAAAA